MITLKHDGFHKFIDYEEIKSCKNILLVGGDSWSNMINGLACINSFDNWVNVFAELMGYDVVILCSGDGDSNEIIFSNLIDVLSNIKYNHKSSVQKNESWMNTYELENYNVNVIVQWSSIIRDFSIDTAWYRPFTNASQPEWDKIDENMYMEYISHVYSDKIYSHKTQYYSWQLQRYFEKWNIPYYFWMGFCNLVPSNVENTEFDIRHLLNQEKWFNLYEKPSNMLDYLIYVEKNILPYELPPLMTEGSILTLQNGVTAINKMYKNVKENVSALDDGLLYQDLHPTMDGHKRIAKFIYDRWVKIYGNLNYETRH